MEIHMLAIAQLLIFECVCFGFQVFFSDCSSSLVNRPESLVKFCNEKKVTKAHLLRITLNFSSCKCQNFRVITRYTMTFSLNVHEVSLRVTTIKLYIISKWSEFITNIFKLHCTQCLGELN
jgi:hypothetical protein